MPGILPTVVATREIFIALSLLVPVVVSDFPEMRKIINTFSVGEIIENHSPEHLAGRINVVLAKGKASYLNHLNAAADELCWENEEDKILKIFSDAAKEIL